MSKKRWRLTCFKCGRADGIVRKGRRKNGSQWGLCHRCLGDWFTNLALGDRRIANEVFERAERES